MNTEMQKSHVVTIVGAEKVPERLIKIVNLMVTKAFSMSGRSVDDLCINFLENHPRNKKDMIYSTFSAPNVINVNLQKHLDQMAELAEIHFMRASTVLWYELLRSVGHELYHMLMEYMPFIEAYESNLEALQIGVKYNCTKAEIWGKKLVLAAGFEHSIDPPDEWATGVDDTDILSVDLCTWQCGLPDIDLDWAKRQQEMIDRNICWLDTEEAPEITLDNFSDWLAFEGDWTMPVWKVRLENNKKTEIKVEEPVVEVEAVIVETIVPEITVTEEDIEFVEDIIEIEEIEDIVVEEEQVVVETIESVPEQSIPVMEVMTQPIVNPTMAEAKSVMYHVFMAVYNKIYTNCGWMTGSDGYCFTAPSAIEDGIDISSIPFAAHVVVNSGVRGGGTRPVWPSGVVTGMTFINGAIPAVKIGIRGVGGKMFTYTAVAQNPLKESSWGKSAKEGVKSLVIFREGGDNNSDIAIRIVNGEFISNPLGLNGGVATVVKM